MALRPRVRVTWVILAAIVAFLPPTLYAQATQSHPDTDVFGTLLRWWGLVSVFVIGALQLWVRSVVRDQVDAAKAIASAALREHDEDQTAHAKHPNAARYRQEMGQLRDEVGAIGTRTEVILERIKSGQEAAASRWEDLARRMDRLDAMEHRLSRLEAEHSARHARFTERDR